MNSASIIERSVNLFPRFLPRLKLRLFGYKYPHTSVVFAFLFAKKNKEVYRIGLRLLILLKDENSQEVLNET